MARDESLPFEFGGTWYQGGTIDTTNLGGVNFEGQTFKILDAVRGTGLYKTVRVVRNSGLVNILPKQLCQYDPSYFGQRVTGNTFMDGAYGFPADELLPAAGVVPNDLFYIVIEGPALCRTPHGAGVTIAVGDNLVAITAASSTSADAGRVTQELFAAATTAEELEIINRVGKAMSAVTSGQTDTDILVAIKW